MIKSSSPCLGVRNLAYPYYSKRYAVRIANFAMTMSATMYLKLKVAMYLKLKVATFIYFLVDCSLISGNNQKSFSPVLATGGLRFCANDVPSSVIMVDDILGIPQCAPDVVRCSYFCTSQNNCTSFNIRQGPPRQCEGFNFIPRNCSQTTPGDCQHFEV